MRITNDELNKRNYVVLSYDHKNEHFLNELAIYDEEGICYWYDEAILFGGSYDEQFYDALEKENCKGIIFFITERFLLSQPCINEMKDFMDKYGLDNPSKFYIVVVPKGFKFDKDELYESVTMCGENDPEIKWFSEKSKREKDRILYERIDRFWELYRDGKHVYGRLNDRSKTGYIAKSCAKGGRFQIAGVLSDIMKNIKEKTFGIFPQDSDLDVSLDINVKSVNRQLDNRSAYYAPVEWLIISEDEKTVTLLSKKILFSLEYLEIKYPLNKNNITVSEIITKLFDEHFEMNENEKHTQINEVRFLSQDELKSLLKCCSNEKQKNIILNPETTFFAQHTNNENAPMFWLAGDTEDAHRVDVAIGDFSKLKPGTETFGVRIVIQVNKKGE